MKDLTIPAVCIVGLATVDALGLGVGTRPTLCTSTTDVIFCEVRACTQLACSLTTSPGVMTKALALVALSLR